MVFLVVAVVDDKGEYDVQQLVLHVVEGDAPRLSCRDEPVVVGLQGRVVEGRYLQGRVVEGRYQRGLGELAFELAVGVASHVGPRVDGAAGPVAERGHAVVGGKLVRVVELGEVARVDQQGHTVDKGEALDARHMTVVPREALSHDRSSSRGPRLRR